MSSYPPIDNEADIEVIKRESQSGSELHDNNAESLDSPGFMQAFDLPSPLPANSGLFDDLDPGKHSLSGPDFLPPNLAIPELDGNSGNNYDAEHDYNYAGALTKYSNPLPPLPPLTEPVILNIPYLNMPMVPEYVSNGVSSRQALIGNPKRKKDLGAKTKPAFVVKIWNMVNDPANHEYIRWTDDGQAFIVVHREEFMKLILPNYFKHNNFASFVRQLNMYGWHKVQDFTSGTMKENAGQEEVLQFKNPDFIRGREDLLDNIVRNKTGNLDDMADSSLANLQVMTTEVDKLRMTQLAMLEDMRRMRSDNQNLWQEIVNARDRERKLTQMIQKIVNFVEAAYGKSAGKIFEVQNSDLPYNSQVLAYSNNNTSGGNTNTAKQNYQSLSTSAAASPRPRLMLMDLAYQNTPSESRTPNSRDGSVEEIVRNGDDYDSSNKFLQQFMTQEPVASPRLFFPELHGNYGDDNYQKLEQKLDKHGSDLVHTQEWIDQISKQQQNKQESPSTDAGIDDFMSEILNEPSTESLKKSELDTGSVKRPAQPERGTRKRTRR